MEVMGLADGLDVKCEEDRRIEDHPNSFGLSNWKGELRWNGHQGCILHFLKFELSI